MQTGAYLMEHSDPKDGYCKTTASTTRSSRGIGICHHHRPCHNFFKRREQLGEIL